MRAMKHVVLLIVALAIGVPALVRAADQPNFSGTWMFDASKSETPRAGRAGRGGRGGGAAAELVGTPAGPVLIAQTETQITIGSRTYKLDGSPARAGAGGAEGKAHWDGSKLVIETTAAARGNTITTKEVRSLDPEGKVMTVEITIHAARGDLMARQVFSKTVEK